MEELKIYLKKWRKRNPEYSKKYYRANKDKIIAWKKDYRKNNRDRLLKDRRDKRNKENLIWRENAKPKAYKLAEDIILDKVISKIGFVDIFRPTTNFYFDSLAKDKNGVVCAIEVSTSPRRVIDKHRISFLKYFKMPLYLFFVKPDLSCYYVIKKDYPNYITNPEYKNGEKFIL